MDFATAVIALMAGIIGLIILLIDLWRRIRGLRPPASSAEVNSEQPGPATGAWRRIIGRLATWAIGGSGLAIALFSALATAGLLGGGFLLAGAVGPEAADVEILSPSDGDAVAHEISVEGKAREREDGESLVVFVRPFPDSPFQDYHAQALPQQIDKRRWDARPVYVGIPEDQPGTPFKICAVITRSQISLGDRLRMLPAGPSDCVLVTRE